MFQLLHATVFPALRIKMSNKYVAFAASTSLLTVGSSRDLKVQKCNRKVEYVRHASMTLNKPEHKEPKKVVLQSFLSISGVAASDTCKLLIEYGFVRVNGVVVKDPRARVRATDHITVKGRAIDDEEPDDDSVLPRSQRDFGSEIPKYADKFNWRVDGGFLGRKVGQGGYK